MGTHTYIHTYRLAYIAHIIAFTNDFKNVNSQIFTYIHAYIAHNSLY
jgi:hypothetical protein